MVICPFFSNLSFIIHLIFLLFCLLVHFFCVVLLNACIMKVELSFYIFFIYNCFCLQFNKKTREIVLKKQGTRNKEQVVDDLLLFVRMLILIFSVLFFLIIFYDSFGFVLRGYKLGKGYVKQLKFFSSFFSF